MGQINDRFPGRAGRAAPRRRLVAAVTLTCVLALAAAVGFAVVATHSTPDRNAGGVAATHTIAEVQGSGAASPYAGSVVAVEGVVTADHRVGGYQGVYIQSVGSGGETDATPGASDGVFVFLGGANPAVAIGDLVRVTGRVREYHGLTEITCSAESAVELVTAGIGVPAASVLPDRLVGAAREQLEGMLVKPTGVYRLSSSQQLSDFGDLWLSAGAAPPVRGTEQARPGRESAAIAAANRAGRLLLDDGSDERLGTAAHPGEQPYFTADTVVRVGDVVSWPDRPYVLSYGFHDWRLQPVVPIDAASAAGDKPTFEPTNPRPSVPPDVGGDIRAASFNVYNYFTTLASDNPSARGARSAAEFSVQKSKIVAAINGLDADVVSLMEIENSVKLGEEVDAAITDLVDGLNGALGREVWAYVPTPAALDDASITDYITTAIIYRKGVLVPVGASRTHLDETVWNVAREPIAQTFRFNGSTVTVVANHFKSKRGDGRAPADDQGRFNAERVAEARAVVAFVGELQAASGSDDVLLLGDFNAYSHEDPMTVFAEAGYVDLVPANAGPRYTYALGGQLGSLDHAIATPSLARKVTGVAAWSINAAEWPGRGYGSAAAVADTPFRSSDHDPVLVGISR